jgi:hypothetical protein
MLLGASSEEDQHDFVFTIAQTATEELFQESLVGEFHVSNSRNVPFGEPTVELRLSVDSNAIVMPSFHDPVTGAPLYAEVRLPSNPPRRICPGCLESSMASANFCELCGEQFPQRSVFLTDLMTGTETEPSSEPETTSKPEHASEREQILPSGEESLSEQPKVHATKKYLSSSRYQEPQGSISASDFMAESRLEQPSPPVSKRSAIAPSTEAHADTRQCPFCAETIKVAAIKCRHCGEFLQEQNPLLTPQYADASEDTTGIDSLDDAFPDTPPIPASGKSRCRIFVSHATQDELVAKEITAALEIEGVGTWLATRDIQVGECDRSHVERQKHQAEEHPRAAAELA